MSVVIKENNIKMTRGDTLRIVITMWQRDGTEYTPQAGDEIKFYLKRALMTHGNKQFVDQEPIITKEILTSDLLLELEPADTKSLDFGNYKYDVEITFNDGTVDTFISDASFIITPEVG